MSEAPPPDPHLASPAGGRKGATRKKLARASGCIVEYIGNYVHMAGTGPERRRAGDYLTCIMNQLDGIVAGGRCRGTFGCPKLLFPWCKPIKLPWM